MQFLLKIKLDGNFMQPDHMDLARKIRHFFATVFAQIKLDTRDGLTDLSKSQEKALLPIINEIYSKTFKDMNKDNANYPGIDYGDFDDGLSLQMTITVSKQKVQETVNKILKYDKERKIKEVWMFFLIVDAIPSNVKINTEDIKIKYMTLDDLSDKVINADLDYQRSFLSLIERQYSSYFRDNLSFSIPENTRVPTDLSMFNDFIETEEWFPDNPEEGYEKIYNFISSFQDCLLSCSYDARKILAYILEVQGIPPNYNSKVKIYLDNLMGRLNINDDNFDEFEYQLELLVASNLVDIEKEFQNFDGMTVRYRKVVVASYHTYEPEINLFSVLPKFYVKHYAFKEYLTAIKNADFFLLSDQEVHNF